ncbi:hypothetical protein [Sphingomonas parapaucimobilis]|uniref:Uncharacterized protein n=1 Tax=Sphingomonas parapaucimobilis NBRC 15100 TaxID=1219049 RepID=A0A0A1W6G7_9SPHN|nr:hypothetical protein [Sphingomonas parapaucimobilis]GAM00726.1 hypothetical protein SP5_035_01270 [Sphingomonas parapaucimobilis NBRC 15100]
MRANKLTIAAIEATAPQANEIFADTRADITRLGAPASRYDRRWHRKELAVWNRFVVRMLGCDAKTASPAALDVLCDLFTELGAINTPARLMAAWDAADAAALPLTLPADTDRGRIDRDQQLTGLKAASRLRSTAPQMNTYDLPLFAAAQQPSMF